MLEFRLRPWSRWIAALLLCAALAVGFAPRSQQPGGGAHPSAVQDGQRPQPDAPILVGRGSMHGAKDPGATPARPVRGEESEEVPGPAPGPVAEEMAEASGAQVPGGDPTRGDEPLTASHPLVAPVIEIQDRHTAELLGHPLVVGTATGMNEDGDIALVVLAKAEITDLPSSIEGAPVMVYVTGELFASKGKPPGVGGGGSDQPAVDPTARFARPVPIGVSTGHPAITAGTIGCRVTDGTDVYALSNNHVYADENQATLGDAVIQPGAYDGGVSPADDIGTLAFWVDLDFTLVQLGGANIMDAALALSDTATLERGTPSDGYGLPRTATVSPSINLRVRKYGRTTGQTNGKIFAINASVNVGYSTGTAGFIDQIVITPGSFSAGGDSGSLIVVQKGADARKVVGLLFAGSSSSTIANPIGPILSEFGVSIDGE